MNLPLYATGSPLLDVLGGIAIGLILSKLLHLKLQGDL
jgi:hypothetical protein